MCLIDCLLWFGLVWFGYSSCFLVAWLLVFLFACLFVCLFVCLLHETRVSEEQAACGSPGWLGWVCLILFVTILGQVLVPPPYDTVIPPFCWARL